MATEKQVSDFVTKQGEGSVDSCYGPSTFGGLEVWEVWVHDGSEFQARFVVEEDNQKLRYFRQFDKFCAYGNGLYAAKAAAMQQLQSGTHQSNVSLYVAAGVFVASFVVLAILILGRYEPNAVTFGSSPPLSPAADTCFSRVEVAVIAVSGLAPWATFGRPFGAKTSHSGRKRSSLSSKTRGGELHVFPPY